MTIPSALRKRAKRIALYLLIAASGTTLASSLNASEPHMEPASHDSVHWCGWTVEEQLEAASDKKPTVLDSTQDKPNTLAPKQTAAKNKTAPSVTVVKQADLFGSVSLPLVSITENDELRITTCNYDNWLKSVLASVPGIKATADDTDADGSVGVLKADASESSLADVEESAVVETVEVVAAETDVAVAEAAEEFADVDEMDDSDTVAIAEETNQVDDLAIDEIDYQYHSDKYYDDQYYDEDRYYEEDLIAEPWNPESPIAEAEITVAEAPTVCTPVDDIQLSVNGELAVNGQANDGHSSSKTAEVDQETQRAAEASLDAETNVHEVALEESAVEESIDVDADEPETVEAEATDVEIAAAEAPEAEMEVADVEPAQAETAIETTPEIANLDAIGHSVLTESPADTQDVVEPSLVETVPAVEEEIAATDDDSFDQVDDIVITTPATQDADTESIEIANDGDSIEQVVQGPVTADGTLPMLLEEQVVSDVDSDAEMVEADAVAKQAVTEEINSVVSRTSEQFNEWLASLAVASTPGTMSWMELSEPLAAIYQDAIAETDSETASNAVATVEQDVETQPEPQEPTAADLVGSSPVIATIEEEYQPYDVVSAAEAEATIAQLNNPQPTEPADAPATEAITAPVETEQAETVPVSMPPVADETTAPEPTATKPTTPITAIDSLINPDRPWTIDSCWVIRQPGWSVFNEEPQPRALTVLKANDVDQIASTEAIEGTESLDAETQPVAAEPAEVAKVADAMDTPPLPQSLVGSADCLLDHWLWQADLLAQDNPWVQQLSDAENLGAAIVQLSDRYTAATQGVLTEIATKLPAPAAQPAPQPAKVQELPAEEQRIASNDAEPEATMEPAAPQAEEVVAAEPVKSVEDQLQSYQELLDNVMGVSRLLVEDIQRQAEAAAKVADSSENSETPTLR